LIRPGPCVNTGRSPVGCRPTCVAHSKIARVARVVFVLYCMWMDVLPSLQFLTVTKCTETTVPSEPLYRTILTLPLTHLPLPFNPFTLTLSLTLPFPFPLPFYLYPYPYPYCHERKSGCNVVLIDKKILYSGVLGR